MAGLDIEISWVLRRSRSARGSLPQPLHETLAVPKDSSSFAEDLKLVGAAPEGSHDENFASVIEHHVVTRL